jgi:hypothetical protein
MKDIRKSIIADKFPDFVRTFMFEFFKNRHPEAPALNFDGIEDGDPSSVEFDPSGYPVWVVNALKSVNVELI